MPHGVIRVVGSVRAIFILLINQINIMKQQEGIMIMILPFIMRLLKIDLILIR